MDIKIIDINKKYKEKKVLENINLNIKSGEIVGLVGDNGAGKSTLMKIIAGLVKADSGVVKLDELTFEENRIEYLKNMSFVIEEPALYLEMSGLDHINFIAKLNNISKDKVNEIIKFINIGDSLKKRCSSYSLGMKQRLALGLALLKEVNFIVLDEPTNGLDIDSSIELRGKLLSLAKDKNVSILISSHILSEIEKICDKVIFIKSGVIIKDNLNLKKDIIKSIILVVDDRIEFLSYISKNNNILSLEEIESNKFKLSLDSNLINSFIGELSNSNIHYTNILISDISLEDEYISLKRSK